MYISGIASISSCVTNLFCLIRVSILFATRAGLAWLDIVDNWTNQYNMLIIGVLECIAVGWIFNTSKVLNEINRNTVKFKMSEIWFYSSIKFITPLSLVGLLCWNLYTLFFMNNGKYGYPLWAEIIGGWVVTGLVFISGIIIYIVTKKSRRLTALSKKEPQWDEID